MQFKSKFGGAVALAVSVWAIDSREAQMKVGFVYGTDW